MLLISDIKNKNRKYKNRINNIIKKNKLSNKKKYFPFNKNIIWKIIFMIFILLIYVIINLYIVKKRNHIIKDEKKDEKKEFKKKRIKYSRKEALTRGRNFLTICLEEKLINNIKFKKNENPKITAIVPIYNSEKFFKKTIRSIQNQNMLDIEIILVNDASTDNSVKVIEELQKEDPRIKLINNEKNMGILYSRCVGVLEAKGKYIVNLDHDDFFFG